MRVTSRLRGIAIPFSMACATFAKIYRSYVYRVESIQIVRAGAMQVLDKTPESVLTLIPAFRSLTSGLLPIASWCARVRFHPTREKSRDSAVISRKAPTITALTRKVRREPANNLD
jgi:hypothetical protein